MLVMSTKNIPIVISACKYALHALAIIIITVLPFEPTKASTIEQLVKENKVELSIRLQNESTPIVMQQLIFEIELATTYSFARSIKYKSPKVKNTANSPRKSPGYSSSKVVNGENWSSQVRELALFSITEGKYSIPPIEVSVAIQTPEQGVIEGIITTAPYIFEVKLPTELSNIKEFIVSTDVQLEIDDNQSDTETFAVGDAVTIRVDISATDVPGMLLPASLEQDIEGLSIYRKSPRLSDKTNRGFLKGRRSDNVTYIFEQAGQYQIPQQIIYWWNPELAELNELIIPAKQWLVEGTVMSTGSVIEENNQFVLSSKVLTTLLMLLIGIILLSILATYRQWLFSVYSKITKRQQRLLRKEFVTAINAQNYLVACQKLYQLINYHSERTISLKEYYQADPKKTLALQSLLALAYNDKNEQVFSLSQTKLLMSPVKEKATNTNSYDNNISLVLKT
ncbi:MAG: hypothetical protein ACI9IA_000114 [Enterobacterales bacterium]|jgi:hypothetical protein